jgi:hypothetical protein
MREDLLGPDAAPLWRERGIWYYSIQTVEGACSFVMWARAHLETIQPEFIGEKLMRILCLLVRFYS